MTYLSKEDVMEKFNRRDFFKIGALAGAGVVATSALSFAHDPANMNKTESNDAPLGRMSIARDEDFALLEAVCERIYPKDSSGPGAIELNVAYFIDNQLAAAWGYNAREYMQGPFSDGIKEQGYQSPMYRREVIIMGLHAINDYAKSIYKKDFIDIDSKKQDEILKACELDKVKMDGYSSAAFFKMLRDLTIAGVLSDPIYGGNKNKMGWKMMQYPGAQMSYLDKIESDKFVNIDPMSLADM